MSEQKNRKARDSALHINHRKRMKEKFLRLGLEPFSEHEIMELLLYYVLPQVDTNEIAHKLINRGGSFVGAFNIPYDELKTITGIKEQAATFLKLIPEIARYYSEQEILEAKKSEMTYEDIGRMCTKSFIGIKNETLLGFYYDAKMRLITKSVISEGGLFSVGTSMRKIVDDIIKNGAANVVFAHNHPTASIIPSADDIDSTKRMQKLFAQFEINLYEHFVVSGDSYMGVLKFDEDARRKYLREKIFE